MKFTLTLNEKSVDRVANVRGYRTEVADPKFDQKDPKNRGKEVPMIPNDESRADFLLNQMLGAFNSDNHKEMVRLAQQKAAGDATKEQATGSKS